MYAPSALEATSTKSRVRQGWFPLKALRDGPSLPLLHFSWVLETLAFLGLGCLNPISASVMTWPSLCVSLRLKFSSHFSYKDTSQ